MASASRLRRRLHPGPGALGRALRHLDAIGAVKFVESKSFPFTKLYKLTDWGKSLVETPMRSWAYALAK